MRPGGARAAGGKDAHARQTQLCTNQRSAAVKRAGRAEGGAAPAGRPRGCRRSQERAACSGVASASHSSLFGAPGGLHAPRMRGPRGAPCGRGSGWGRCTSFLTPAPRARGRSKGRDGAAARRARRVLGCCSAARTPRAPPIHQIQPRSRQQCRPKFRLDSRGQRSRAPAPARRSAGLGGTPPSARRPRRRRQGRRAPRAASSLARAAQPLTVPPLPRGGRAGGWGVRARPLSR